MSPFNAHRLRIDELLAKAGISDVPVGTVDKFQGQEAAVSIYTMATSRPEDAPRGVDFLYSLNRLNVATSRARALTIVVCSPALLNFVPKTPDQLRMANGLAAFVEMSRQRPSSPSPGRATVVDRGCRCAGPVGDVAGLNSAYITACRVTSRRAAAFSVRLLATVLSGRTWS